MKFAGRRLILAGLGAVLVWSRVGPANAQSIYQPYAITTLAGFGGATGSTDGNGNNARFYLPQGVAADDAGNIFVADTNNNTIRKITAAGEVSTIAGAAGIPGSVDGPGYVARFWNPYAVAIDKAGNLFVADSGNHTIRKITPVGIVSTLAGLAGAIGSTDGTGSDARFYYPSGIAADGTGNIYVADTTNQTIRKITAAGVVSTLAGSAGESGSADGPGSVARFYYPIGVATRGDGAIFVTDTYNYTVRKISADRIVTTLAGTPGVIGSADGFGSAARFNAPWGVAVDGTGNVFVVDRFNNTIRKISSTGVVRTLAGSLQTIGSADGVGYVARFYQPVGVAADGSGTLYVADTGNSTIRAGLPEPIDGALDPTFNAGDFTNGQVFASVLQPDGKLIIGGTFNKVHGVVRHSLARLNADGTLDLSFDAGLGPDSVYTNGLILQSDGKLIIAGPAFTMVNGISRDAGIARLNSDGSLDTAFDPGSLLRLTNLPDDPTTGSVWAAILQPDGKIILAGQFSRIGTGPDTSVSRSCIARFNSDGTFDPSFDPGSGCVTSGDPAGSVVRYLGRQKLRANANKLILEGSFDSYDGHPVSNIVRINANGGFDGTFTPSAEMTAGTVTGLLVQTTDQIVIPSTSDSDSRVRRFNNNGDLDGGFSAEAFKDYLARGLIEGVTEQPDGKLIVFGEFHSLGGVVANNVVRLDSTGNRDSTFDASVAAGPSAFDVNTALVRPGDGGIFLGGYFSSYGGAPRNNLVWVGQTGALDLTFAGLSGATDYLPQIYALAAQPDGKILVGGLFSSFQGSPRYNLVRLNADATLDSSFESTSQTEGSVRAIFLQPDGKILIAGNVRAVGGVARGGVARLNTDGTLDSSFVTGASPNAVINALTQDSAGNVYLGGSFTTIAGAARTSLAKLGPSGTLDPTFNPGSGLTSSIYALTTASDPNFIIIGSSSRYNGVNIGGIARINAATGALDGTFNSGGSGFSGQVFALKLGPDGKYYAGGSFGSFNGMIRSRVARLNADGSLDASFAGPSLDITVRAIALRKGKVLLGGEGGFLPRPVLLTHAGALDPEFDPGAGVEVSPPNAFSFGTTAVIWALSFQPDGQAFVGGVFNRYNGVPHSDLVRLTIPDLVAPSIRFTSITRAPNGHIFLKGMGVPGVTYLLQFSDVPDGNSFSGGSTLSTDSSGAFSYENFDSPGLTRRYYRLAVPDSTQAQSRVLR